MSLKSGTLLRCFLTRPQWILVGSRYSNSPKGSFEEPTAEQKKKKKAPEVRINLFTKNKEMTVVTIENAQKLAKRRGVLLTKIENPAKYMLVGDREAYQLTQPADIGHQSEDQKLKEAGNKGLKQMQLSSKIAPHDFEVKMKKVSKWLENGYVSEVFVLCPGNDLDVGATVERLEATISNAKSPGKIKKQSKSSLKIIFEPSKEISGAVLTPDPSRRWTGNVQVSKAAANSFCMKLDLPG